MIERLAWFSLLVAALSLGCSNAEIPSDSETHFLTGCDEGCGSLECVCGICTTPCEDVCLGPVAGAICRTSEAPSLLACEAPEAPPASFCDLPCDDSGDCTALGTGRICLSGYCRPQSLAAELETSTEPDAAPPAPTNSFERDASTSAPPRFDAGEPFPVDIR